MSSAGLHSIVLTSIIVNLHTTHCCSGSLGFATRNFLTTAAGGASTRCSRRISTNVEGNPFRRFALKVKSKAGVDDVVGQESKMIAAKWEKGVAQGNNSSEGNVVGGSKKAKTGDAAQMLAVERFDGLVPDCEPKVLPFVARQKKAWRERYSSVCVSCFDSGSPCPHYAEKPLRLLILGHNPSNVSWQTGISYGNPSNRFWPCMRESSILPADWREEDSWTVLNNMAPSELGIGFTDIGLLPGSDAAAFKPDVMRMWYADFIVRAKAHSQRCGADPCIVAFTGKRHFAMLFTPQLKKVQSFGRQDMAPPGWPLENSEIWVMPSPSGRAAMTAEERLAPYRLLSARLKELDKIRSDG